MLTTPLTWRNGQILEASPTLSVYDAAFMYGDAVFEMLRTYRGAPFELVAHLDRFLASARAAHVSIEHSRAELAQAHVDVLELLKIANPEVDEWRTLLVASRGILPLYDLPRAPWVAITGYPLAQIVRPLAHFYDAGVTLLIPDTHQIPDTAIPAGIKHKSRLHFRLAEVEVQRRQRDAWPLLLSASGCLTEGPGFNVVFLDQRRGCLVTPHSNVLAGISLATIERLAPRHFGLELRREAIHVSDVLERAYFTEAFVTGTPFGILPVAQLEHRRFADHTVTRALTRDWIDDVGRDFVAWARTLLEETPCTP